MLLLRAVQVQNQTGNSNMISMLLTDTIPCCPHDVFDIALPARAVDLLVLGRMHVSGVTSRLCVNMVVTSTSVDGTAACSWVLVAVATNVLFPSSKES